MKSSDKLAGHTFEELSDYLDRDRSPADPSIDGSPECEIALRGMERLRNTQRALLKKDVELESEREDSWVSTILQAISIEARAGRDIPISHPSSTARLSVTEGAVRGILRAAGDSIPNIIVGRCRLDGDVSEPGAPVTVRVDATVLEGEIIPSLVVALREALYVALHQHTELAVEAVDITIRDLYQPVPPRAKASSDE
ncbi:hypothetical protein E3T28_03135 [Cryobacterium sinapicolor]|uniref:Asp23/Gls24 family envelope stress response protein n=1 Tax=Cryobacterium sinapicolor TaxID=1259236 RepID=A0ABY2JHP4_9MICO|nr:MULTISPECIES: hypothetical protein [Cryobacterium]TFC93521.1 hypothetical protein E3O67_01420 [Cryobacterium sp. TMT3-29-2]TFD04014.1 hypothetical protein E3T28_03135 [Cryobacterium sinapicolor]